MNRYITFLLFGLIMLFNKVSGQTFKQQFSDLVSKNDTLGQQQLLDKWNKKDSNDPELYVAYFNYFVKKSRKEIIRLDNNSNGKEGFQIMDKDSSKIEPVGFMSVDSYYNIEVLKEAFDQIDKGIKTHPNRLDMRFGKIYILGQTENYENFTSEIIKTIDNSALNKNLWTWAENKPVDSPKDFMLSSIQDYQVQLYNTGNDSFLDNMKRIAEAVLKQYPDHIESLSNLSIVFMLKKQYDKALEPLLEAQKLDPKDVIVLGNIAQAYKLKGDKTNAIKYYKLTNKYGDDQEKKYSKAQLIELKKK